MECLLGDRGAFSCFFVSMKCIKSVSQRSNVYLKYAKVGVRFELISVLFCIVSLV